MEARASIFTRWLVLGGLCLLSPMAPAAQPHIVVITGAQAPQLSFDRSTLRNVYLKRIYVDGRGQPLIPVNLPSRSPLREAFSSVALHMDDAQQQDYWDRQYYQGVSPPYVLASSSAVVRFVAQTPGAIGYVEPCAVDATVHVVLTIALPPRLAEDVPACSDHRIP